MKQQIGIISARFQTPYLHEGHRYLIDEVKKLHEKVIIFLGISKGNFDSRNPLDFISRKMMINTEYPDITVLQILDKKNDHQWSKELDNRIDEIKGVAEPILYGSRESFIEQYSGKYKTVEIENKIIISASQIRKKLTDKIIDSEEFRHGVIYGLSNNFPSPYITVDIVPINRDKNEVLLAKKVNEKGFRFIGGFVDSNDNSILDAARREVHEETGRSMELSNFKIIGEAKINDWRYIKSEHKIFTIFYACDFIYGIPYPNDDINYLEWVQFKDIKTTQFEPEHEILKNKLLTFLNISEA